MNPFPSTAAERSARALFIFVLVLCLGHPASARNRADLVEVPTEEILPIYQPRNSYEESAALAAVESIRFRGEGPTVDLILRAAPHLLGVPSDEAEGVRRAIARRYRRLHQNPDFLSTPSPLPSAFVRENPTMLVIPPRHPLGDARDAPALLFLHGYGGSGKLYAFMLADALPHVWVVAPSHGVTWRNPNLDYVDDVVMAFFRKYRTRSASLHLVGLSDGGWGAFSIYAKRPEVFSGMVSIAATPPGAMIKYLPRAGHIAMLNGRRDRRASLQTVREKFRAVKKRVPDARLHLLPGGHFFFVRSEDQVMALLKGEMRRQDRVEAGRGGGL
jgi:pimeloyl-ACP methyl ester carboxylesterase